MLSGNTNKMMFYLTPNLEEVMISEIYGNNIRGVDYIYSNPTEGLIELCVS